MKSLSHFALIALGAIITAVALPWASAAALPYKVLYSFCAEANCADGYRASELVADRNGNFFGATYIGGSFGAGTVFELVRTDVDRYQYKVIYDFCRSGGVCVDGKYPFGPLVLDKRGNLYGLNYLGSGFGQAFELAKSGNGWIYRKVYRFCSLPKCADSAFPYGGLTYAGAAAGQPYDGSSPLFGVTYGTNYPSPNGAVFELQPVKGQWQEQLLFVSCRQQNCTDGGFPDPSLVEDTSGNLYGTMEYDGENNYGAIFELQNTGASWSNTFVHHFCSQADCTDGQLEGATLAIDSFGSLYGGTAFGGDYGCGQGDLGCGVAYRLPPGAAQTTVLHTFCETGCSDGFYTSGNVVLDRMGNLFGTAYEGGDFRYNSTGGGTVYELTPGHFHLLHQFCQQSGCTDGGGPVSLTRDPSGRLFGTTYSGGAYGKGVIFEIMP